MKRIIRKPARWDQNNTTMRTVLKSSIKLLCDETGGEVLEYALVAGLIIVAALSVIGQVGSKVTAKWTSLNSRL